MTAKKTAEKSANPFDEEPKAKGLTLPETVEDKKGSSLPVDDSKDSEPSSTPKTEPSAVTGNPDKDPKPKTTRKRRTKAEIEAEKSKTAETSSEIDFTQVDHEKYPLSAVAGQVVGSISLNSGAVPTISIALQGWIGEPPIFLAASQIGDIEDVLKELKKQAKDAVRKS